LQKNTKKHAVAKQQSETLILLQDDILRADTLSIWQEVQQRLQLKSGAFNAELQSRDALVYTPIRSNVLQIVRKEPYLTLQGIYDTSVYKIKFTISAPRKIRRELLFSPVIDAREVTYEKREMFRPDGHEPETVRVNLDANEIAELVFDEFLQ